MATTLFPISTAMSVTLDSADFGAGLVQKQLSLTRGGAAASQTDASGTTGPWGDPLQSLGGTSVALVWITNPLNAVTVSGNITVSVRALENNAMANAGAGLYNLWKINSTGAGTLIASFQSNATELGTTEAARAVTFTPTSTALSAGDRLLFSASWTAVGVTATGFSLQGFYNGPTSGASGDTFITFTETITEQSGGAPADIAYLATARHPR